MQPHSSQHPTVNICDTDQNNARNQMPSNPANFKSSSSKWSTLPVRLLTVVLSYSGNIIVICSAQTVCKSWRLPEVLEDTLVKGCFERDYGAPTASAKEIADKGPETEWIRRYKRAKRTDLNWKQGIF